MPTEPRKPWFSPKRYGYGSGLPIAWQGWLVLALYMGTLFGAPLVLPSAATVIVCIAATIILVIICARRTAGGWRWRSGG